MDDANRKPEVFRADSSDGLNQYKSRCRPISNFSCPMPNVHDMSVARALPDLYLKENVASRCIQSSSSPDNYGLYRRNPGNQSHWHQESDKPFRIIYMIGNVLPSYYFSVLGDFSSAESDERVRFLHYLNFFGEGWFKIVALEK